VVALHPQHLLTARDSIPLCALRGEPMVTLTPASKLRSTLETACQAAGFVPDVVAESSDLRIVVELAAEQIGVAVLPRSALEGTSGVAMRSLTDPSIERRIMLVSPPTGSSPAGRAFLTLALHHLGTPS
jgi:DNA-binding transcriptional LysR family regulator